MKKRLLSVLLCLTLVTILIPGAALAENAAGPDTPATAVAEASVEPETRIEPAEAESSAPAPTEAEPTGDPTGVTVTVGDITEEIGADASQLDGYYTYSPSEHTLTILRDGVTVSGNSDNLALKTGSDVGSVTLKDLALSATNPFRTGESSSGLTVSLSGTVSLTGDTQAIQSNTDLTLQGGTLTVQGTTGIQADCHLTLDGVSLEVTGTNGCGIQCSDGLSVQNDSTVTATGSSSGIRVTEGTLFVEHARLSAQGGENGIDTDRCQVDVKEAVMESAGSRQCGFRATGGSTLSVVDSELTAEGGQYGLYASCTSLALDGATIDATGTDGTGIAFSGADLTVEGITLVTAKGADCGLEALNCTVTIDSSTIEANGSGKDSCGLRCSGGTLTATSDAYVAATGGASGICADGTTVTLDCSVVEATATNSGSGLSCSGSDTLSLSSDATLTASGPQCGVYAEGCAVTLDRAAVIADGTHDQGLYCRSLSMSGSSELIVTGGTDGVSVAGGTVYLDNSSIEATGTQSYGLSVNFTDRASAAKDAVYADDAPLIITTGSSVTAQGGSAGIAANCDAVIRDSSVTASGEELAGIFLSPADAGGNLAVYGSSAVSAQGPDRAGIYTAGTLSISLTRGGSLTSSGILSQTGISRSSKTRLLTPENGYIGTGSAVFNGQQCTCYTVLVPARDDAPATVADHVVFGCIEDNPTCTVTFDSDGGSPVDSQKVYSGTCVQEPEPPIRNGFFFLYWADESGAEYDFDTPVTADLTLTAVWKIFYTVTFDSNGGSPVDSQMVRIGACAQRPENPVKAGYVFQYWECEDGNEYDFDTPVRSDVALFAVWEEKTGSDGHSSSSQSSSTASHRASSAKTGAATAKTAGAPETGDSISLPLLAGGLILSGAGIAALVVRIRRKGF